MGREGLTGRRHRVSLTGKSLGRKKLGRAGQFRPQCFRLTFEAVGVVRSALHEGPLATLLQLHDLELETYGVVFQTGIHHHHRAYPARWPSNVQSANPARRLRREALASSSADSRAVWTASSRDCRVDPMRSPASALAVTMAPLAFVQ